MNKKLRGGLSILLTIVLTATLIPILGRECREVSAQDFEVSTEEELINNLYKEQITDGSNVKKIILQNDIALSQNVNLSDGTYILDLNGHKLTYQGDSTAAIELSGYGSYNPNTSEWEKKNYADFTITDSVGTGSMESTTAACVILNSQAVLAVQKAKMYSVDYTSCIQIESKAENITMALSDCDLEVKSSAENTVINGGAIAFQSQQSSVKSYLAANQVINNDTVKKDSDANYTATRLIVSEGPENEELSVTGNLDFGSFDFGTASISDTRTMTIQNSGNRDVVITDISLDTSLQEIFSLTTQAVSANSLIPSQKEDSTVLSIKSVPTAAGTYSGNVTVTYESIPENRTDTPTPKTLTIPVSLVIKEEVTTPSTPENPMPEEPKTEENTPFTLNYIDIPQNPYTILGTQGENNWYTSDVTIVPPFGYTISQVQTGVYTESLLIKETSSPIVFLQDANGGVTQAIPIGEIKIDTKAPAISGIANGATHYADSVKIKVFDEHLASVTVNGDSVTTNAGESTAEITLTSDNENPYEIIAKDEAGHITSYTVNIQDTWMRDGITKSGRLRLKAGIAYRLGAGKWTVAGDTTVYEGGTTFYATKSGDYDFTLQ